MRRCASESCQINAEKRSFDLAMPVVDIIKNADRMWAKVGGMRTANNGGRQIAVDWNKFNDNDYLITHCSICCSVNVEDNGFYIKAPCDELVNNNGNAWTTPVLKATFRSFRGAQNFLEHDQDPNKSKGTILDAIIRPVKYSGRAGGEETVWWVDILLATDRKHEDLIYKIENGKIDTLSMGCAAEAVQCSKCGKISRNDKPPCRHVQHELLSYFYDNRGVRRIVSELCGVSNRNPVTGIWEGDPNSVAFIEASWVETPAFEGAVINHFISRNPRIARLEESKSDNIIMASNNWLFEDLHKLRVADEYSAISLKIAREELRKYNER